VFPGPFYLNDVLVAPDLVQSLLSVRRFTTDNSCSMEFDPFGLSVKDLATWSVIVRYDSSGSLYTIPLSASATFSTDAPPYALAVAASTSTWHRRLGHPSPDVLSQLSRSLVITCPRASSESLCHACQLGRHIRLPFPSSSSRVVRAFDLILCNLWTSPVTSVSGYKYYLVILDDCTHYSWTFPLRHKSDTFPTLSHFFTYVSTQFGCTIRSVQRYNGREFDNSSTRIFFLSHSVQLRMSCPYTSPQNSKAERMIRTTNDVIRSLLFQASLPARYWAESLHAATYLLNLLPTKAISAPSPHFALFGTTPTYGSSGAPATRTPVPLLPISSPLTPVGVSFLGTPLSTRGIGVSISTRTICWSPSTSSSMSHPSPLPPPAHLLTTWTPSSRPVMQFA
jgi:hypothetical protein